MKSTAPLPFDGFLSLLKAHGFPVTVHHYLRLFQLLGKIGGECRPERLAGMLCPLFATSEEEQDRFHALFARYFTAWSGAESAPSAKRPPWQPLGSGRSRSAALVVAAIVVILAGSFVAWKSGLLRRRAAIVTLPIARPIPLSQSIAEHPLKGSGTTPGAVEAAPGANDIPPPVVVPETRWTITMHWLGDLWVDHASVIVGIVGLAAGGFLLAAFVRWSNRSFLEQGRGPISGMTQSLPLPEIQWPEGKSPRFQQLGRRFRRRQAAELRRFDMAGSIAATIDAGGYPQFRDTYGTQVPEYVVLVDRVSFRDHQAEFFNRRIDAMREHSVLIAHYFFSSDPRVCVDRSGRSYLLRELKRRHPAHRLLVFSDGQGLLDPLDGTLAQCARGLLDWSERILLTPEDHWNWRERVLERHFTVQRATLDGMEELGAKFEGILPIRPGRAGDGAMRFAPEDAADLTRLRAHLGQPVFRWLCACAVYPELHWALTLHLRDLPSLEAGEQRETTMTRLFRLPWFRVGFMPDPVRTRLVATLEPHQEADVHNAVVALFEAPASPVSQEAALDVHIPDGDARAEKNAPAKSSEPYTKLRKGARAGQLDVQLPGLIAGRFQTSWWNSDLRIFAAFTAFVILFTTYSYRLIQIQVTGHDLYAKIAAEQHTARQTIHARRGMIQDIYGERLAQSEPVRTVVADNTHIQDREKVAALLAPALGMPHGQLMQKFEREVYSPSLKQMVPAPYVILKKLVPEAVASDLATQLTAQKLRGITFEQDELRVYPNEQMLCHILGYVNSENAGVDGVERTMDQFLRGNDGFRYIYRDRTGKESMPYRGEEKEARNGGNVRLTIDMGLQNIVEMELDAAIKQFLPKSATVILMRPKTGEILALANRPNFNLNVPEEAPPDYRRDRAIADIVEPGSVFKVVTVAAALTEKIVQPTTMINCENGYFAAVKLHDNRPYSDLSVHDILVKSSNIGVAKLAIQLGDQKFYEYVRRFGFGERTGVDLPGEIAGIVHPPHMWSKLSITRMPMGQEVGATALQMTTAMCVIANGGHLMMPQIIHDITDEEGHTITQFPPQEVRSVASTQATDAIREALIEVVSPKGTAALAHVAGYKVAGKTGTAQKLDPDGQYSHEHYIVSFVGFMPAEDPAFVGLVLIDDPQVSHDKNYGGMVAAPVFSRIGEKAMRYLGIPASMEEPFPIQTIRDFRDQ